MVRRLLVLGMVLTAVGLARAAGPAGACSCVDQTTAEAVAGADAVFVATSASEPTPTNEAEPSLGDLVFAMEVERVYRGAVGERVEVRSFAQESACGLDLSGRHLVIAHRDDDGDLTTGLCSGTRPLAAGEVPPDLGPGEEPAGAAAPAGPAASTPPERPIGGPGGDVVDPGLGPVATAVRWAAGAAVALAAVGGVVLLVRSRRAPAT